MDITSRLLWASISILFLHFFEEFGAPGGFPYMGVKNLLGKYEKDPSKWNCNNLSSMFGNWLFLLLVYCLPLFFPNLHLLTLAAMMFSFAELLMHLILFNVRLKACYTPGMITGVFMLPPIAIYYFARVFDASMFSWYHYVIAVVWFVFVFWLSFRSPIYWAWARSRVTSLPNNPPSECTTNNHVLCTTIKQHFCIKNKSAAYLCQNRVRRT